MEGKIIYFWLAGFYVKRNKNLVCPPPSCSDTASSTVWGALARSQEAVCIAPAAAAATAAGGCLLLALLLLLPPPGSGDDGCCIRSCLAPHRHLACQSKGGGSEGWSASEGPAGERVGGEAPCAHPPQPVPAPARQGPAGGGGGGGARRLAHLAGEGTAPGAGRESVGRDFEGMRSSRGKVKLLLGVRACERTSGGRGAGEARAAGRGYSPGRWRWQGESPKRRLGEGAGRGGSCGGGGGGHYYSPALARRGQSTAQQVRSAREQVCAQL